MFAPIVRSGRWNTAYVTVQYDIFFMWAAYQSEAFFLDYHRSAVAMIRLMKFRAVVQSDLNRRFVASAMHQYEMLLSYIHASEMAKRIKMMREEQDALMMLHAVDLNMDE